jgi:hypothetical protein
MAHVCLSITGAPEDLVPVVPKNEGASLQNAGDMTCPDFPVMNAVSGPPVFVQDDKVRPFAASKTERDIVDQPAVETDCEAEISTSEDGCVRWHPGKQKLCCRIELRL